MNEAMMEGVHFVAPKPCKLDFYSSILIRFIGESWMYNLDSQQIHQVSNLSRQVQLVVSRTMNEKKSLQVDKAN